MKGILVPARTRLLFGRVSVGAAALTALLFISAFAGWYFWHLPEVKLLVAEGGAVWIRFPDEFRTQVHQPGIRAASFRRRFEVRELPKRALLTLHAMNRAAVFLDGRLLERFPPVRDVKERRRIDLTPWLQPGSHELRIDVENDSGHPALLAYCPPLEIRSGAGWEAIRDGRRDWQSARSAEEMPPLAISQSFPRTDRALKSRLSLFAAFFAVLFFWSLGIDDRRIGGWVRRLRLSPVAVRWLILGVWLAIAVNNFWKLPLGMGMDHEGHLQYIRSLAATWHIPLPTEGWQTFQPPLFHALAACLYSALSPAVSEGTIIRILKLLPLVCGAAQVEICYRTLRYAYPRREDLQILGTCLGGLLPMNLYISQSLGNEPLAGLLTALIVMQVCRALTEEAAPPLPVQRQVLMGILLGFALLAKVTAVLIVLPLIWFGGSACIRAANTPGEGVRSVVRFGIVLGAAAGAVSGWYYLRNYLEMGMFFVGGWDPARQIHWWQDPGYRTLRHLYTFGASLFNPVFASIQGFWDAIYSSLWADGYLSAFNRPPWNYPFMLSGVWFSLLPSAAIALGSGMAVLARSEAPLRRVLRFSAASVVIYLAAIFSIFLTVPILSSAKATYALGLTPCIALLGTAGLDVLTRSRYLRAVSYGLFGCWVLCAGTAFFAIE